MDRPSPVEMRKALEAVEALKRAGILFVPIPVLSQEDHSELIRCMTDRMERIIIDSEGE